MHSKIRLSLWIGLSLAVLFETVVQLVWKSATAGLTGATAPVDALRQLLFNPLFQFTVILWVVQFFNWLLVLARSDLSFAQPMSAISYITVVCAARFLFHETISPQRAAGIALIVVGAWLMGGTAPHTRDLPIEAPR